MKNYKLQDRWKYPRFLTLKVRPNRYTKVGLYLKSCFWEVE